METTISVAPKITKRKYTRRNSQRTTENPSTTIGEIEPVVQKQTLVTEMSQPTSTFVMTESSTEPMLSQSQQLPVVNDTNCVPKKITKRRNTRRNNCKITETPFTLVNASIPVAIKPEPVTEMLKSNGTLVALNSPREYVSHLPVANDTNCVPNKITKGRYTMRNSCKITENPFTLVNASIPVAIKPKPVTEMLKSNGTLVALNSPSESVSHLPVANGTNCVPKQITKRRYTRRKTMGIPFPNIDESTLTTNLATQTTYAVVAAKSPQPQPKPPVVNDTNCAPKKITKRRYTRRNSFPMINRPTFTTNSVPVMTQPTYALVLAKSPSENLLLQPKPPAVNDTNCVPKKITKRRYTRRNSCRTVENPFVVTNVNTPVVATPTPVSEMKQLHCTLMVKSPSESGLLQSKPTVDTNCIPKKITKRRYTRRNSCRTTENPFTKFDAPPPVVLTSSPLIVTPQPESVPPVEINHPPEIEEQQAEHENELWYHKKTYSFLKSLKQDYKRFKYLFNYLLREEQEKERRNIQELDELKRIYNRMQVEETEIKRKRWCRYCELEASYLTSVGIQFYCSKECERKQNNLLSAVEDSLKQHRE